MKTDLEKSLNSMKILLENTCRKDSVDYTRINESWTRLGEINWTKISGEA